MIIHMKKLSLIIAIFALCVGTVAAAQVALPDSPLYGLKTTIEEFRISIAQTEETKAKTYLSIAEEKLSELEAMSAGSAAQGFQIEKVKEKLEQSQKNAQAHITRSEDKPKTQKIKKEIKENKDRSEAVVKKANERGNSNK
jgi:hypothetical protein